jgi:hypothetical protein
MKGWTGTLLIYGVGLPWSTTTLAPIGVVCSAGVIAPKGALSIYVVTDGTMVIRPIRNLMVIAQFLDVDWIPGTDWSVNPSYGSGLQMSTSEIEEWVS